MAATLRKWQWFCKDWWGLDPSHSALFWQALQRSRYDRPRQLRLQLALAGEGGLPVEPGEFTTRVLAPEKLVQVLEDLVDEGRLTRLQASHIEDKLLTAVGPTGGWRPERGRTEKE